MLSASRRVFLGLFAASVATGTAPPFVLASGAAPLASWANGDARERIISFVESTVKEGGPSFVPPEDRIAVFDNDGTLWSEKPAYFQLFFALDRIKAMAPDHPEWKDVEPYKSILADDFENLAKLGEHALLEVLMQTHAGMSVDQFQAFVTAWLANAKHPKFQRGYDTLVFQPMLELLSYLRDNGYQTWIVSGGGIEFLRTFAEKTYGIPPQQVVGSSIVTEFQMVDGKPTLVRLPKIDFIDDKAGKPVGINKFIGKRPIFAAGNSDGDLQMLQWTSAGAGPRFGMIVHHTDADREFAYDRESSVGRLDKALDEAPSAGWLVVDIKNDWTQVFPAI
ncbi:MAG: HAD family hydrolase [Alphaproteobacteria bacterium]|nr:HAD family hydrolase [Alphaproteobacteria bacterium]